jgi:predicted Rossmann fold nucleotide-binding protein DprA/Smf involved in DNA uptake
MKIAIVGSRGYYNLDKVCDYVESLPADTVVVSGGAQGVDLAAEMAAKRCGLKTEIYPAQWNKYGRAAGYLRNKDIVAAADKVVAFHDGVSKGTQHTINIAREMGKPLVIFR